MITLIFETYSFQYLFPCKLFEDFDACLVHRSVVAEALRQYPPITPIVELVVTRQCDPTSSSQCQRCKCLSRCFSPNLDKNIHSQNYKAVAKGGHTRVKVRFPVFTIFSPSAKNNIFGNGLHHPLQLPFPPFIILKVLQLNFLVFFLSKNIKT